jgi:hypothetical protein
MIDPWSAFLYGMKAPMDREKITGRIAKFLIPFNATTVYH